MNHTLDPVRRVGVIGAGTMGHGIAQIAAMAGCHVQLVDQTLDLATEGLERIRQNLQGGIERGKVDASAAEEALGRIQADDRLAGACDGADLVIEAVPEHMGLKKEILSQLGAMCPREAILGSNTSSLSVTELQMATGRPELVIGLHFFNPVHIMKLLEVVVGERTSEATVERARRFGERIGKTPIIVQDSPGFATSRLGIALGNEAMRMVGEGVASAEDIDKAMTLGYRHPMGPLALSDLVGLDVRLAITEHLYAELGTDTFRPPQILKRLVRADKLGRKSGEGFYRYDE